MTKIIAEIASSHNGDIGLAKALIKAAALNGADIVKFQDWKAKNVPESDQDKARYTLYEFKDEWYPELMEHCEKNGVEFLTSVFNVDRVQPLAALGLKRIKIASISMDNTDLLMMAGLHFEEVIISTAMHTKEEIEEVADLLISNCSKFTLMHCTANYPLNINDANLGRIDELKKMFDPWPEQMSIGYSDHSLIPEVPMMALSKGISYLEKHFTLSRHLPQIPHQMYEGGPLVTTHEVAIEPHELREIARFRDYVAAAHHEHPNEIEQKIKQRYVLRYGK